MPSNLPKTEPSTGLVIYELCPGGINAQAIADDIALQAFMFDVARDRGNLIPKGLRLCLYWKLKQAYMDRLIAGDLFTVELATPFHSEAVIRGLARPDSKSGRVVSLIVSLDSYLHSRDFCGHASATARKRARLAIDIARGETHAQ